MRKGLHLQEMKKISLILIFILSVLCAQAQSLTESHPAFKTFHWAVIDNDTVLVIGLRTFYVYPPEKFKNKKAEQYYWRTVRDVKKTLPYAKLIYSILIETYEYMETLPDDKAREEHMKVMEKEIFQQYKPVLKKFTLSQGKMLIKLINRECNQSSYALIKAFLGTFRANFWQLFGKMFGASLKTDWDPEGKDQTIERICVLVEQGNL